MADESHGWWDRVYLGLVLKICYEILFPYTGKRKAVEVTPIKAKKQRVDKGELRAENIIEC